MSTTYVQALPDVRGRMSYTEFGEGKRRRDHLQNGTDRIAAQMGDMPSRGEFIAYCNGLHAVHPNMVNEGYELRVSWALDELNPGNPDDVQRGMEHAYLLCHELAPDSPCWVTMHVDGEGGCVHAHATIANHDCRTGQVINKDDTSLFAPRVQAVNDELSREWGLSVIGADKDKSTWAEKRDSFEYDSFDRHLGDAVAKARDDASDIDDFKQRLAFAGVTLNETSKIDKKTGEKSVGWSYRMRDEWGPKRRTRKRRASNLADDLTKEGVERFFEEKQEQQTREELKTAPAPNQDSQMVGMEDTQQDSPAQHDFDMYEPSESDVKDMTSDLKSVYARRRKSEGRCGTRPQGVPRFQGGTRRPEGGLPEPRDGIRAVHAGEQDRDRPRLPHDVGHDGPDVPHDDAPVHGGPAPQDAGGRRTSSLRISRQHVGRREAPEGRRGGSGQRGRPHRQASRRHAEDAADGRGDGARARRGQVPRGVKK